VGGYLDICQAEIGLGVRAMTTVASVGAISDEGWPIVASKEFILAMRDTGYRNTATAIAELIDNSLQARASIIEIRVYEQPTAGTSGIGIAVLDNGKAWTNTVSDEHSSSEGPNGLTIALGWAASGWDCRTVR